MSIAAPRSLPGWARIAAVSLVVAALIGAWMSWPVPRYLTRGIAYTSTRHDPVFIQAEPGDHLQLLHYFWLVSSFLEGRTPWFHNVYEFNTGDDAVTRHVDPYYAPFSLVFAMGNWIGGPALGWNLAGFASVWLAFLGAWRLARLHVRHEGLALLAALPALMLPYRWVNLAGGSPTGFTLMFVPWTFWAVEKAVRQAKPVGGLAVGLFILLASFSDAHTFFFLVLAAPVWAVWTWLDSAAARDRLWDGRRLVRSVVAMLPALVGLVLSVAMVLAIRANLQDARAGTGRELREIALFSPRPFGLWAWNATPHHGLIYLGGTVAVMAIIAVILAALAIRAGDRRLRWAGLAGLMLVVGIAGVALLSLGTNIPLGGDRFWGRWIRLIPPYRMIRQPAKVFVLMMALLPVLAARVFEVLGREGRGRWRFAVAALWTVGLAAEYPRRISPSLCGLEREQPAYAAAAADAAARGETARMLALPLWPGDSHWTSINVYYASLHRIRLVNGYLPFPRQGYFEDIFLPLSELNQGVISDKRLDQLLDMGVRHLAIHENAFPEKVSPFPVAHTIEALMAHPRIAFLAQSRAVWTFRVLDAPGGKPEPLDLTAGFRFPTRRFGFGRADGAREGFVSDPRAVDGGYLELRGEGEAATVHAYPPGYHPGLRYRIRLRGAGRLEIADDGVEQSMDLPAEWTWIDLTLPAYEGIRSWQPVFTLHATDGGLDPWAHLDTAILMAGPWDIPAPGEVKEIPAPAFFRAGYTDRSEGPPAVVFDPVYDRADVIFYGPTLPLPPGRYRVRFDHATDAPRGTLLGRLGLRGGGDPEAPPAVAIRAGLPETIELEHRHDGPFTLAFRYAGAARMRLTGVRIERLP